MELKKALFRLSTELKNNEDYRHGWGSNIAMAYKDREQTYRQETGKKYLNKKDRHIIANDAAGNFL